MFVLHFTHTLLRQKFLFLNFDFNLNNFVPRLKMPKHRLRKVTVRLILIPRKVIPISMTFETQILMPTLIMQPVGSQSTMVSIE